MEINKFYCWREVLCNNYRSCNLIGHYPVWVISPRNSTLFTTLFLAGRPLWAGQETNTLGTGTNCLYWHSLWMSGLQYQKSFSTWKDLEILCVCPLSTWHQVMKSPRPSSPVFVYRKRSDTWDGEGLGMLQYQSAFQSSNLIGWFRVY